MASLGLPKGTSQQQLRHGGATSDFLAHKRTLGEIQMRGRWSTSTSLKRYTKAGQLQKLLAVIDTPSLEFCAWADRNIEKIFRGQVRARLAPNSK